MTAWTCDTKHSHRMATTEPVIDVTSDRSSLLHHQVLTSTAQWPLSTFMLEKHQCQAYGLFYQCRTPSRDVLMECVTVMQAAAGLRGPCQWDISHQLTSLAEFKTVLPSFPTHGSTMTLNCLFRAGQPHWAACQELVTRLHIYSCIMFIQTVTVSGA